jgi:hypothetical protein
MADDRPNDAYSILISAADDVRPTAVDKKATRPADEPMADPDPDAVLPQLSYGLVGLAVGLAFIVACVWFFVGIYRSSGLANGGRAPAAVPFPLRASGAAVSGPSDPALNAEDPMPVPPRLEKAPRPDIRPKVPIRLDPRFRAMPGGGPGDTVN